MDRSSLEEARGGVSGSLAYSNPIWKSSAIRDPSQGGARVILSAAEVARELYPTSWMAVIFGNVTQIPGDFHHSVEYLILRKVTDSLLFCNLYTVLEKFRLLESHNAYDDVRMSPNIEIPYKKVFFVVLVAESECINDAFLILVFIPVLVDSPLNGVLIMRRFLLAPVTSVLDIEPVIVVRFPF
jgi:hypothetical protein